MKCRGGSWHLLVLMAISFSVLLARKKGLLCSELPPEEVPPNAMEPLTERLVKESNLLVEESRVEGAAVSIVEPPKQFEGRWNSKESLQEKDEHTGGPGDTYISMSSDGSARYRFGFDTKQQTTPARNGAAPRLMREESRLEDGTVVGRYGYTDPFGVFRIVQYVAGPEGYFASEHVGAISDNGDKVQLNKQLRTAIELARRRRLASEASQNHWGPHQQRHTRDSSGASVGGSTVTFATSINHIVGSNGRSYSTAFRPTKSTPRLSSHPIISRLTEPHREPIEMNYQKGSSPSIPPVYESSRTRHVQALRASDAWSVLSNTYNDQESPLIINHGTPGEVAAAKVVLPDTTQHAVGSRFELEFGKHAETLASIQKQTSVLDQSAIFGARSIQQAPQEVYLSPGSHLNPPLYHPEVHMAEFYQHSAPQPERSYALNNLKPDKELTKVSKSATRRAQLTRRDDFVHEHPVRYATRLSALATVRTQQFEAAEPRDELSVEASEQVSTNTTSRARMPDRSKKLSAILKPRSHSLAGEDRAKIKKPKPLNMKPPNQEATAEVMVPQTIETSTEAAPKVQEPPLESTTKATIIKSQQDKKFGRVVLDKMSGGLTTGTPLVVPEQETRLPSSTSQLESSSRITLIDTIQSNADLLYDKELYEKIVRIQQEIAAKNLGSSTSLLADTQETQSDKLDMVSSSTVAPTITSTSNTPLPTGSSTSSEPEIVQAHTTVATITTESSNSTSSFVAQYIEPEAKKDVEQVKKNDSLNLGQTLPTGPLFVMNSSIDQDELMANFTLDIDPFDSARGSTTTAPPIVRTDELVNKIVELKESSEPTQTSNISSHITTQSSNLRILPTVDTTTPADIVSTSNANNSEPNTSELLHANDRTTLKHLMTDETTTSTLASTQTPSTTTIRLPEIISSSSTTSTTVLPSTSNSLVGSTTQATLPSSTNSTIPSPITTIIAALAKDTSNITITSTTTTSTSTQAPPVRSTFGQPRFGRLVIKREGKVVARYNGTEPIPDSLIPIGTGLVGSGASNGEALIVPDMPRLSMRRAVKRKAGPLLQTASVSNLGLPITATDSTSSTTRDPLLSEASEWSPIRKSLLRRGTRSSMLNSKDSQELVASEVLSGPEIKLSDQNNEVKAKRFTSYQRARSWSARIRGHPIPSPSQTNMSYESKEDLRKMVDKIEKRLMAPVMLGNTTKHSSLHPLQANTVNQTSRQSKSSSAIFTIPLSVTQRATSATQLDDSGVFSNEQIQLRHNQSLTVHVDIEPPGRQQSSAEPIPGLVDNRVSKRLVSRDTQASVFSGNPRDDMLRLPKSSSTSAPEQLTSRTTVSRTIQEIKEATIGRKRNPRMLCIEVDAGASLH